jgi:predicted O-methyltransferase YrrM
MILHEHVERYVRGLSIPRDDLLTEIEAYAQEHRVPIAAPDTAALVAMLARTCGARYVLEIGLALGYTALQVARAIPEYAKVVSLEVDMHMAAVAKAYLARDAAGARVEVLLGDARGTLPELRERFDLVFIDADKESYGLYVELCLPHLRRTGVIVLDNMLMDGCVARGKGDDHWPQESVDAALALNARLAGDAALSYILVPVGDGVGLVQRR